MEGKTHLAGGIAAGSFFLAAIGQTPTEVLFFAGAAAGSLLPDICSPTSTVGRKFPILSRLTNSTFGHRTFTHSLVAVILVLALFKYLSIHESLEVGLLIGMVSHLILDALTKDGIQFFWPLKIRVGIPFGIRTGGFLEPFVLALLVAYVGYFGYTYYL